MNILKCLFRICATLCLIAGTYSPCFSDGSFFPVEVDQIGNSALSPNQRAVIIHDGESETMIVQVKYSGNVQDFAWVIPLPALPEENGIQTESDSIFTQLHDRSQPRVYQTNMTTGYGRGGGGGGGPDDVLIIEDENAQAQVWQNLSIGPYDVQIISGTTSQAVHDWLNSNGYDYPASSGAILDFYVQRNWYFMATKVNVTDEEPGENSTYQAGLPALKVTFLVDKPVFPLRISEISSANENEIEIYVIADHRMISDSYPTYAMVHKEVEEQIKGQIDDQTTDVSGGLACACRRVTDPTQKGSITFDYESIFRNKLTSLPSGSFIIEYVGDGWTTYNDPEYPFPGIFDGYFDPYFSDEEYFTITRLRTFLTPEEMVDDVTFIPDPAGDDHLYLNVFINQYNPWQAAIFGLPLLLLFPLIISRKFRKQYGKHILLVLIALYLILI